MAGLAERGDGGAAEAVLPESATLNAFARAFADEPWPPVTLTPIAKYLVTTFVMDKSWHGGLRSSAPRHSGYSAHAAPTVD